MPKKPGFISKLTTIKEREPYKKPEISQELREFGDKYKNNFKIIVSKDKQNTTSIFILGPNNKIIAQMGLRELKPGIWEAHGLAVGEYSADRDIYRNLGFAKALILRAAKYAKENKGKQIIFGAVPSLIPMYEKLGARRDKLFAHSTWGLLLGKLPMSFDLTKYNPNLY